VIRHILADSHKRIGHDLPADMAVRENGFRMKHCGVLPLFDVNRVFIKRDRLDLPEPLAASAAQLLAAAKLGFLRREHTRAGLYAGYRQHHAALGKFVFYDPRCDRYLRAHAGPGAGQGGVNQAKNGDSAGRV
jgi:hypothetical protein